MNSDFAEDSPLPPHSLPPSADGPARADGSAQADEPARADGPARVALVGAGPGDPGLLTLRGRDWLRRADVVLFDGLSNADMLVDATSATKICVGKHGQTRIWKQEEIVDELLRHARAGRCVVRLKGGDPAVFARTSEEVDALVAAGIAFEIVPGITAALAAGSYAGIPITHRGIASAVALVTGHEQPDKGASDLNWPALAAFPGTLVIYMGVTTAHAWTRALIDGGKDPATPCAIIRRCSLNDQQRKHCRLDEVADTLTPASKMRPPVITIVGPVTELAETMDWFSRRPLMGKRILVSRPVVRLPGANPDDPLGEDLRRRGAVVLSQPVMSIVAAADPSPLDDALDRLATFDWIVFSSRNAVRCFGERLRARRWDARAVGRTRIAAVGEGTASELEEFFLRADLRPATATGRDLAAALADRLRSEPSPGAVLSIRGDRGRDHYRGPIQEAGGRFEEVIAYEQTDGPEIDQAIRRDVAAGGVDWVAVTSGEVARRLHLALGDDLWQASIAVISPAVAETIHQLGGHVDAVAQTPGLVPLVDAIVSSELAP